MATAPDLQHVQRQQRHPQRQPASPQQRQCEPPTLLEDFGLKAISFSRGTSSHRHSLGTTTDKDRCPLPLRPFSNIRARISKCTSRFTQSCMSCSVLAARRIGQRCLVLSAVYRAKECLPSSFKISTRIVTSLRNTWMYWQETKHIRGGPKRTRRQKRPEHGWRARTTRLCDPFARAVFSHIP